MRVVRCLLFIASRWLLVGWLVVVCYLWFVACCLLLVGCCSFFVALCWLLVVRCSLFVARVALLGVVSSLFVVCCLLYVDGRFRALFLFVCCSLVDARCVLLVVCC